MPIDIVRERWREGGQERPLQWSNSLAPLFMSQSCGCQQGDTFFAVSVNRVIAAVVQRNGHLSHLNINVAILNFFIRLNSIIWGIQLFILQGCNIRGVLVQIVGLLSHSLSLSHAPSLSVSSSSSLFGPFSLAGCSTGQHCFILIAYFRLKKLVFLDYFDVEMGAREQFTFTRQYVFPPLFCANSRIPIYILALELNYCKHLCVPAEQNGSPGSCNVSVPPVGACWKHTWLIPSTYGTRAKRKTLEWVPGIFAKWIPHGWDFSTVIWRHLTLVLPYSLCSKRRVWTSKSPPEGEHISGFCSVQARWRGCVVFTPKCSQCHTDTATVQWTIWWDWI